MSVLGLVVSAAEKTFKKSLRVIDTRHYSVDPHYIYYEILHKAQKN